MRVLFFILVLALSQSSFAKFKENQVARLDDSKVTFYVDKPQKVNSYPYIVFMQGSECRSIYNRPFMPTSPADMFHVGVVLVEKYGITKNQYSENDSENCTQEYRYGNTLDQRVQDYLRVIQFLRTNDSNWNQELLIIGGSEGGSIAPIVGAYVPETKKIAMLVAGNGRTMREDIEEVITLKAREAGATEAQVEALLEDVKTKVQEIKKEASVEKYWMGHNYKWWHSILWVRPLNYMLSLNIPQLLIHGTRDTSVPVESARVTNQAFIKRGFTHLEYQEYKGLDHSLTDESGNSQKGEIFMRAFKWLLQ